MSEAASGSASPINRRKGWEADERPEPRSLGLLPSGPDPVGEWLVHRQPPGPYICRADRESKEGGNPKRRTAARLFPPVYASKQNMWPSLHQSFAAVTTAICLCPGSPLHAGKSSRL